MRVVVEKGCIGLVIQELKIVGSLVPFVCVFVVSWAWNVLLGWFFEALVSSEEHLVRLAVLAHAFQFVILTFKVGARTHIDWSYKQTQS